MTRLWTTLALGLAATSPAFAQSAGNDKDKNGNNDTSNQAGPTETNTNTSGTTPQGDVNDRTGADRNNPSDSTAPTNEPTTTATTNTSSPQTTTAVDTTQPGYVAASTRETTYVRTTERERMGLTIAAGGGTSGFTGNTLRDSTNMGGDWDVRLTFGSRSPLAFEASYIGSAQKISALGLNNNAMLIGNGAQGALRLNLTTDLPVQPFLFGGAAWRRYSVTNNANNTSDVANKDDVLEIPVGAGFAGKFMGLVLDARGEFRYTTNADLVATGGNEPVIGVSNDHGTMHRWGLNANIGYEF